MGFLNHLLFPWGLLLQGLAILHFIRRRPDTYWLYIILFLGPLGALVYLFAEAIPDLNFAGQSTFKAFPRRRRISVLETEVRINPSAGNYEELGDLYMDEGKFQQARAAFDKAIAGHINTTDSFYRRGICAIRLGDAAAAIPDLERVVSKEPGYDFHRSVGMLAQAYAMSGQKERAESCFRQATDRSTSSEIYLNFADLLAAAGRHAEAREWAQKVLDKQTGMPRYLRRQERPWFRRAKKILSQLPAA